MVVNLEQKVVNTSVIIGNLVTKTKTRQEDSVIQSLGIIQKVSRIMVD